MNANIEIIVPKRVEKDNATVEKLTIPSIEYLNKLQKDQLVSPAILSIFSYSNHLVLNPTHWNNPFENLLYSESSKTESTTWRVIKR